MAVAAGGIASVKKRGTRANVDENAGLAVVATNRGYLRFFSSGGVQRYLWSTGDEVVSMVARQEHLFLVHRSGGTSLDGQWPCESVHHYSNFTFRLPELEVHPHKSERS